MKIFSRILKFFFTEKKLEFVQLICAFVQKMKKCPDVFSEREFRVSENVGTFQLIGHVVIFVLLP